jgi:hypothetical protein
MARAGPAVIDRAMSLDLPSAQGGSLVRHVVRHVRRPAPPDGITGGAL